MKKYIDSITIKKFDLNILDIFSIILSLTVFGLVIFDQFNFPVFYRALFMVPLLIVLMFELKSEEKLSKISTKNNIIALILIIAILEIVLSVTVGKSFPLFYLLLPVFYGIFGLIPVIVSLICIFAIQLISTDLIPAIISLIILSLTTFLFGPILKNSCSKYRYIFFKGTNHGFPDNSSKKPFLDMTLGDIDTYKSEVRESLNFLGKLIEHNSIILYLKDEDGLYEIYDYISNTPDAIDSGQRLLFRSGYINWLTKTNSPIMIDEIKNLKENAVYYSKTVEIKSLMAIPLKNKHLDKGPNSNSARGNTNNG